MRWAAIVTATLMALAILLFHLHYASTLWFMLSRVIVTWFGFAFLVVFVAYGRRLIMGSEALLADKPPVANHLDLVSRPDEEGYYR